MSQLLKSDCRKAQAVSPVMLIYICRKCPAEPVMSHTTMKRFAAELQRHCGCSKWTVARLLSNRESVVVGPPFRPRPLANPVLSAVGICLEALSWPWQRGRFWWMICTCPVLRQKDRLRHKTFPSKFLSRRRLPWPLAGMLEE